MTFFRYLLIQVLAYVADMGVYVLFLSSDLTGPVVANVLAKSSAGFFAFIAHRHFTFMSGARADRVHQAIRYFILLGLNVPFASAILAVFLIWVNDLVIAKLSSDVLSVGMTFWLSKTCVFVSRHQQTGLASDRAGK